MELTRKNIHPIAEFLNNIFIREYGTKYIYYEDFGNIVEILYPSYYKTYLKDKY